MKEAPAQTLARRLDDDFFLCTHLLPYNLFWDNLYLTTWPGLVEQECQNSRLDPLGFNLELELE
jgi:hypothetical protein